MVTVAALKVVVVPLFKRLSLAVISLLLSLGETCQSIAYQQCNSIFSSLSISVSLGPQTPGGFLFVPSEVTSEMWAGTLNITVLIATSSGAPLAISVELDWDNISSWYRHHIWRHFQKLIELPIIFVAFYFCPDLILNCGLDTISVSDKVLLFLLISGSWERGRVAKTLTVYCLPKIADYHRRYAFLQVKNLEAQQVGA